jgi:hypothetical protein
MWVGWGRAGCYVGRGRNVPIWQLCKRGDSLRGGWVAGVMECGSTGVPHAINFFGLFNIFPRSAWPALCGTEEFPACRLVHALPDLHSTIQNLGAADRIHVSSFLLASPARFPLLRCLLQQRPFFIYSGLFLYCS